MSGSIVAESAKLLLFHIHTSYTCLLLLGNGE